MNPIRVACGHCNAQFKAPAKYAGKNVKCPQCSGQIHIPAAELEDLPDASLLPESPLPAPIMAQAATETPASAEAPVTAEIAMTSCPYCLASIPAAAAKCRHCGEFVGQKPAQATPRGAARQQDTDKLSAVEYVTAIVLSPIGLVLGVMWLIAGYGKSKWMLAIAGPLSLLWGVVGYSYLHQFIFSTEFEQNEAHFASQPTRLPGGGFPAPPPDEDPELREEEEDDLGLAKPPSEEDLQQQPIAVQNALRANVRLVCRMNARAGISGSGVVIKIDGDQAWILTNRHVVDVMRAVSDAEGWTRLDQLMPIQVTFVTGDRFDGKVIWVAPDEIDLAIVTVQCPSSGIALGIPRVGNAITQGENVFAVGNPAGLGWTLTRGAVSALRDFPTGTRSIPVVQTDAAISQGNSGGGLYSENGELLGINNFIINPELASNVGFAIRMNLIHEIYPELFNSADSR